MQLLTWFYNLVFGRLWGLTLQWSRDQQENTFVPTLSAIPGDLSLVLPKGILNGIIKMISIHG